MITFGYGSNITVVFHYINRFIIIAFFLMTSQSNSFGQFSKLDELSYKMFFNIFIREPDSSVFDFVKKYFPAFTEKVESGSGGWTMYPPGPRPILQYTIHSLKFDKHPFFDAKFREGRLDISASEEKEGRPGITGFDLWFMFDTKKDADAALKKLSNMFAALSTKKKITKKNDKIIAQYSGQIELENTSGVFFVLTKDELYDGKYKLLFKIGSFNYLEY
jgi:hypothetical protein